jgi:hypothetical protein
MGSEDKKGPRLTQGPLKLELIRAYTQPRKRQASATRCTATT